MLLRGWLIGVAVAVVLPVGFNSVAAPSRPTLILVDKATNVLHLAYYNEQQYEIIKTFRTTVGKVKGDKETEGDLKTPEGIYTFKARLTPPSLKAKFGKMAFYLNYPNAFDQIAGHGGTDIMLHATDEPERLKKDFDSEGCVVVNNEDIEVIKPYIHIGLTPMLIFSQLKDEYLKPGGDSKLKAFFESWLKTWETEDVGSYIDKYHSDFSAQGKNKTQWKDYKASLAKRYAEIRVKVENVLYFRHPKYSMITFVQNYRSKLRGGGVGHVSRGTKILYVAEEEGQPKIIAETYTTLMW